MHFSGARVNHVAEEIFDLHRVLCDPLRDVAARHDHVGQFPSVQLFLFLRIDDRVTLSAWHHVLWVLPQLCIHVGLVSSRADAIVGLSHPRVFVTLFLRIR